MQTAKDIVNPAKKFSLFLNAEFSTFPGKLRVILLAMLIFVGCLQAGELPPATSNAPGPGDVTTPQKPVPSSLSDLSFLPTITDGGVGAAKTPEQVASVLQIVALLTFIGLAPGMLLLTTCFLRIMIVLSFLRRALGTQTMPPDQVMVAIALFLSVFIMAPTWEKSWNEGLKPYLEDARDPATNELMTQEEMFSRMLSPMRYFMFSCLEANEAEEELLFFMGVSGHQIKTADGGGYWIGENGRHVENFYELSLADYPTIVLIPTFISSELKRAFWIGFLLYLPFLILDMVIASVLMSMGMMMLPPVMVSLPFKIVLFILVDGWKLLMEALVTSFPPSVLQFFQNIP